MSQPKIPPNPEFELHLRRLILKRQMEERYGIVLTMAGVTYFILILVCWILLLLLRRMWITGEVVGISGGAIITYFIFSGLTSIRSGRQPITSREVHQQRRVVRMALYRQARGELPYHYTFKGRAKTLLIGSVMISSSVLILLFSLRDIPELAWVRMLFVIAALVLELMLILDTLYLTFREARNLPAQSAYELNRLLASGEMTTGEPTPGEE